MGETEDEDVRHRYARAVARRTIIRTLSVAALGAAPAAPILAPRASSPQPPVTSGQGPGRRSSLAAGARPRTPRQPRRAAAPRPPSRPPRCPGELRLHVRNRQTRPTCSATACPTSRTRRRDGQDRELPGPDYFTRSRRSWLAISWRRLLGIVHDGWGPFLSGQRQSRRSDLIRDNSSSVYTRPPSTPRRCNQNKMSG